MADELERWPGYTEQSWSQRFAEIDRINNRRHEEQMALIKQIGEHMKQNATRIQSDAAEIASLKAQVAEAREALKPFADCCEQISDEEDDEEWAKFRLLIKDYRRAAQAIRDHAAAELMDGPGDGKEGV